MAGKEQGEARDSKGEFAGHAGAGISHHAVDAATTKQIMVGASHAGIMDLEGGRSALNMKPGGSPLGKTQQLIAAGNHHALLGAARNAMASGHIGTGDFLLHAGNKVLEHNTIATYAPKK